MATIRARARIDIDEAALERESGEHLRAFHRSLTRRIANQSRVAVPVRTGNLGRTIGELPQVYTPFRVRGGVEATADYAAPVHEGSRPHAIRARNAQYLHFWWHGREMFRKSVWHPGTRARPFMRNSAQRVVTNDPRVRMT
ncbi:hypothetical protein LOPSY_24 [Mycobacterium phage Lopsy]|nr:hypothetical protein Lopsy_24 [Mycobacterium phage Lopsy]